MSAPNNVNVNVSQFETSQRMEPCDWECFLGWAAPLQAAEWIADRARENPVRIAPPPAELRTYLCSMKRWGPPSTRITISTGCSGIPRPVSLAHIASSRLTLKTVTTYPIRGSSSGATKETETSS